MLILVCILLSTYSPRLELFKMPKILILGGSGLVGTAILEIFGRKGRKEEETKLSLYALENGRVGFLTFISFQCESINVALRAGKGKFENFQKWLEN